MHLLAVVCEAFPWGLKSAGCEVFLGAFHPMHSPWDSVVRAVPISTRYGYDTRTRYYPVLPGTKVLQLAGIMMGY